MKTSQQPTSQSGADEWTCSLAAFRASLSVMPGDEEARRMTATSGRQCIAPSTKSSPLGLWLRTLLESSRWSSRARFLRWQVQPLFSTRLTTFEDDTNCERPLPFNASAQTLKVTDMPSSRCLFRLVPSEPPTDETGCSSSQGESKPFLKTGCKPTPPDQMRRGSELERKERTRSCGGKPDEQRHDQRWYNGTLPTPLVVEREHPDRVENLKAAGATRINSRVNGEQRPNGIIDFMQFYGMLPTPTAIEGVKWTNTWNPNSQMGQSLSAMAGSGMLPTPKLTGCLLEAAGQMQVDGMTSDGQGGRSVGKASETQRTGNSRGDRLGTEHRTNTKSENAGKTSRLSPLFTEEMMGFPLMWTALPFLSESGAPKPSKPTATPSSPK